VDESSSHTRVEKSPSISGVLRGRGSRYPTGHGCANGRPVHRTDFGGNSKSDVPALTNLDGAGGSPLIGSPAVKPGASSQRDKRIVITGLGSAPRGTLNVTAICMTLFVPNTQGGAEQVPDHCSHCHDARKFAGNKKISGFGNGSADVILPGEKRKGFGSQRGVASEPAPDFTKAWYPYFHLYAGEKLL